MRTDRRVPGRVSGSTIVRGTHIFPDGIVGGYELWETMEELQEGYPCLSPVIRSND